MKTSHGGARSGAGRKTSAIENDVRAAINEALDKNPGALSKIWSAVIKMSMKGSKDHAQLFFNYYYGKPKENLDQPTEMVINVIRKH